MKLAKLSFEEKIALYKSASLKLLEHYKDRLKDINYGRSHIISWNYKDDDWIVVSMYCQIDNEIKWVDIDVETGVITEGKTYVTLPK